MRFILLLRYTLLNHIYILFTGRVQHYQEYTPSWIYYWVIPHGYYTSSESVQCTAHIGRNGIVFFIIVHSITHVLSVRLVVSHGYASIMCYTTIHNVEIKGWYIHTYFFKWYIGLLRWVCNSVSDCIIIVLYILCICVYIYVRLLVNAYMYVSIYIDRYIHLI